MYRKKRLQPELQQNRREKPESLPLGRLSFFITSYADKLPVAGDLHRLSDFVISVIGKQRKNRYNEKS